MPAEILVRSASLERAVPTADPSPQALLIKLALNPSFNRSGNDNLRDLFQFRPHSSALQNPPYFAIFSVITETSQQPSQLEVYESFSAFAGFRAPFW